MSINKPIQLGLCCINTILRNLKTPIFSSRKMIVKSVKQKGIDELKKLIIKNLEDTLILMDWNENNGIKVFRLSSELFPHKTNKLVEDYTFDFAIDLLKEIGRISKIYNQRLTFHPGQYNVVGSPNKQCFQQTCIELKYHADILDLMELDDNSVMVVHGGGTYGDKSATIDRWCHQFTLLPENVKRRLVLENCEKSFSIIDCLEVSDRINIPVVFDTHHFECYKKLHPEEAHLFEEPENYMERILNTWKRRGIKPKFHVSEQGCGKTGHHSDYINEIPQYLLEIPERYGVHIDIMIEAKMKEQAILRLYEKYPELNCKIKPIKIKQIKKVKKYNKINIENIVESITNDFEELKIKDKTEENIINKDNNINTFISTIPNNTLNNNILIKEMSKKNEFIIEDHEDKKTTINISEIPNIIHIGNIFKKNTNSKGKWKLEYLCDKNIQKKENGRIYFIVIDDEIYKIGSSECKGGIKNTFAFYEGGLGGSPSIRTFGIHLLIQEQLSIGKTIKIYVLFIEPIKVLITGLFSSVEKITYPQIKEMEYLCCEDYKKIYGKYPNWNFQENVEEWPEHIKLAYKEQVNNR